MRQDFKKWRKEHYKRVSNIKVERYNLLHIDYEKTGPQKQYTSDEVINHYIEYYQAFTNLHDWKNTDMKRDELTKIVFSLDKEEIEFFEEMGGAAHPCSIAWKMKTNICDFYDLEDIPRNPYKDDVEFDKEVHGMHPFIFGLIKEWIAANKQYIDWTEETIEDFWRHLYDYESIIYDEENDKINSKEEDLKVAINSIDEYIFADTNGKLIGDYFKNKICEVLEVNKVPVNNSIDEYVEKTKGIHPVIYYILLKWFDYYDGFGFFDMYGINKEDFWNCFTSNE